ncbi:MAG: DUF58 domain-containing protein [Actinomycetes bacterium]
MFSPSARRLATIAGVAVALGLLTGRAAVVLVGVLPMVLLARVDRRGLDGVRARVLEEPERVLEGEHVGIPVVVTHPAGVGQVACRLIGPGRADAGPAGLAAIAVARRWPDRKDTSSTLAVEVRGARWGRWDLGDVEVVLHASGGLLVARGYVPAGEIWVFPIPEPTRARAVPDDLPHRVGEVASRVAGSGVELSGVRPFRAGDRPRRVNWAVSGRRRELHVTELADERAVDLVALVDTTGDVVDRDGRSTSLDRAVRGVVAVAARYLDAGDRVGLVAFGSPLRWLRPDQTSRQLYRVTEAVLRVRGPASMIEPDLERVPRQGLPPRAVVIAFTPLLHPTVLDALTDLRARGHPLVVVDVLGSEPDPGRSRVARLALRAWRLDRLVLVAELGRRGVPVINWDESTTLDAGLAAVSARRLPVGWRG